MTTDNLTAPVQGLTDAARHALEDLEAATSFTSRKSRDRHAKTVADLRAALAATQAQPATHAEVLTDAQLDALAVEHVDEFILSREKERVRAFARAVIRAAIATQAAQQPKDVGLMLNGLTEAETAETASVAGLSERQAPAPQVVEPIPMLLHCPKCGAQHVDAVESTLVWTGGAVPEPSHDEVTWDNPPHRSHLCHHCGCIWRPADVPTTGVKAIATKGKADTWEASAPSVQVVPTGRAHELKTDPEVFDAVASGAKTHEIRFNDRDFCVGDRLVLLRTESTGEAMRAGAPLVYTGQRIERVVSHVLSGYGLAEGWVILSFAQALPAAQQPAPWTRVTLEERLGAQPAVEPAALAKIASPTAQPAAPSGTNSITADALRDALSNNLPLSTDQRAVLYTMVVEADAIQQKFDAELERIRAQAQPAAPDVVADAGRWQPIETAPKDRGVRFVGLTTLGRAVTAEPAYCVYENGPEFRGYHEVERGSYRFIHLKAWMPLQPYAIDAELPAEGQKP